MTLFDDSLQPGEICPGLLRNDPPSTSSEGAARQVLEHARHDPETIRSFIREKAAELAKGVCDHQQPLVTWQDDPATTTCGQFQSAVIARVSLKVCACTRVECVHLARVAATAGLRVSVQLGLTYLVRVRGYWAALERRGVVTAVCCSFGTEPQIKEKK